MADEKEMSAIFALYFAFSYDRQVIMDPSCFHAGFQNLCSKMTPEQIRMMLDFGEALSNKRTRGQEHEQEDEPRARRQRIQNQFPADFFDQWDKLMDLEVTFRGQTRQLRDWCCFNTTVGHPHCALQILEGRDDGRTSWTLSYSAEQSDKSILHSPDKNGTPHGDAPCTVRNSATEPCFIINSTSPACGGSPRFTTWVSHRSRVG
jgi:hypothetical protein